MLLIRVCASVTDFCGIEPDISFQQQPVCLSVAEGHAYHPPPPPAVDTLPAHTHTWLLVEGVDSLGHPPAHPPYSGFMPGGLSSILLTVACCATLSPRQMANAVTMALLNTWPCTEPCVTHSITSRVPGYTVLIALYFN